MYVAEISYKAICLRPEKEEGYDMVCTEWKEQFMKGYKELQNNFKDSE
jgi:hypothetical protein